MSPLMITLLVVGVIVLLVAVVVAYRMSKEKQKGEPMLVAQPRLISNIGTIAGDEAPLSTTGREFTYNFWIFVRDWDSNAPKHILHRGNDNVNSYTVASPSVWLYPKENKLMVRVSTHQQEASSDYDPATYFPYDKSREGITNVNPMAYKGSDKNIWNSSYSCDVENIPLQRWVQVSVCMWNRTLDVYINGKLARSCILPGVPAHDPDMLSNLYVGQGSTFNGYMARFKYFNRAVTADEIMTMYKKGPLPTNWWWQSFKNRMKVILEIDSDA